MSQRGVIDAWHCCQVSQHCPGRLFPVPYINYVHYSLPTYWSLKDILKLWCRRLSRILRHHDGFGVSFRHSGSGVTEGTMKEHSTVFRAFLDDRGTFPSIDMFHPRYVLGTGETLPRRFADAALESMRLAEKAGAWSFGMVLGCIGYV